MESTQDKRTGRRKVLNIVSVLLMLGGSAPLLANLGRHVVPNLRHIPFGFGYIPFGLGMLVGAIAKLQAPQVEHDDRELGDVLGRRSFLEFGDTTTTEQLAASVARSSGIATAWMQIGLACVAVVCGVVSLFQAGP